jgi:hypothetical protein
MPFTQVNVVQACTFVQPKSVSISVAKMHIVLTLDQMKNRKLLIPVRCTTRKFYLQPPPPGKNNWYVRFAPPATNGIRRVIFRSTGAKEIAAAKRIAAQIIESFWADAGRGADRLKLRNDDATVGELIERYERNATQRPATVRSNARSLRMIVKTVHPGDPDIKPSSILTANLIREFEKRQLERAEQRATLATRASVIQKVRISTASYVRQARAIVALRKMKFYEGLKLPDLTGFRGETVEAPKRYRSNSGTRHPECDVSQFASSDQSCRSQNTKRNPRMPLGLQRLCRDRDRWRRRGDDHSS